jgi:hypothetical protein
MIKYFCDRCGKETKIAITVPIYVHDGKGAVINQIDSKDICEDCAKKLYEIKDELVKKHYLQDFLLMSDEDIEPFRYVFKAGDKVITDDGRTGTITEICTCDRCKKRGFYEPKVQMDIGVCQIWITDTDKENGFRSFYQIGDRVFGNVDKEASKYILQRIEELERELTEYEEQLEVVRELKENNNGN